GGAGDGEGVGAGDRGGSDFPHPQSGRIPSYADPRSEISRWRVGGALRRDGDVAVTGRQLSDGNGVQHLHHPQLATLRGDFIRQDVRSSDDSIRDRTHLDKTSDQAIALRDPNVTVAEGDLTVEPGMAVIERDRGSHL